MLRPKREPDFPCSFSFLNGSTQSRQGWIIGMPSVEESAKTVPSHLGVIYPIR